MKAWLPMLVLLVPLAAAHDEADAPSLRDDVVRVWHEPEPVIPGHQWQGFIRFEPGHNVTDVRYQICRVGQLCFAGATLAERIDDDTWRFDTSDYKTGKNPVAWGINFDPGEPPVWRVGVQYFLFFDGQATDPRNATLFPQGIEEVPGVECDAACYEAWAETHYLAFDMPAVPAGGKGAPLPWALPLAALGLAAWSRRR